MNQCHKIEAIISVTEAGLVSLDKTCNLLFKQHLVDETEALSQKFINTDFKMIVI